MKDWRRTSFTIKSEVLHVLNKVPRTELPNKSRLVEGLLYEWLLEHGYQVSGSLGEN